MTREQAEFIQDLIDGELYEDYSGRGMYGDTTDGVCGEISMEDLIIALWTELAEHREVPDPPYRIKTDSIGRGIIIY